MQERTEEMRRLEQVLDAYGANPGRWPKAEADELMGLVRRDREARARFDETTALERVLAAAPGVHPASIAALTDRIAASAKNDRQPVQFSARPQLVGRRAGMTVLRWPAIAALAASLFIGFYAGTTGWATPALQQVSWLSTDAGEASGVQNDTADDSQEGDVL